MPFSHALIIFRTVFLYVSIYTAVTKKNHEIILAYNSFMTIPLINARDINTR